MFDYNGINKKYRDKRSLLIIPAYLILPLIQIVADKSFKLVHLINVFAYLLISFFSFIYFNKKVMAEIKDGNLHLYTGIGLYDPSKIKLESINTVDRKTKTFLSIHYDHDKIISMEAPKRVSNQIENDLIKIINRI